MYIGGSLTKEKSISLQFLILVGAFASFYAQQFAASFRLVPCNAHWSRLPESLIVSRPSSVEVAAARGGRRGQHWLARPQRVAGPRSSAWLRPSSSSSATSESVEVSTRLCSASAPSASVSSWSHDAIGNLSGRHDEAENSRVQERAQTFDLASEIFRTTRFQTDSRRCLSAQTRPLQQRCVVQNQL